MSIQALRERLSALNNDANNQLAEAGSKTWTKEEQAKFDNTMDEAERVQSQIVAHQRVLDESAEKEFSNLPKKKDGPQNEHMEGYEIFLRKSDRLMSQEEVAKVRNTMSTTTGSEGGFTVQSTVAKTFIEAMKSFGAMRRVASQITTERGEDLSYPTTDGTGEEGEIVAQNAPGSDLDVSFGTRGLNVVKWSSKVVTIPIELLQDSGIDVVSLVNGRLRKRIGRHQNKKYTTGTGTGEPMGAVTAASVGRVGAAGQVTTVTYDDLVDLVDSLDAAYLDEDSGEDSLPGAAPRFMFSQTVRRALRKIKDTAGRPIWTPSYDEGMAVKRPDLLLGYPVTINNDMPAPAASAKSIAFGSLDQYVIRDAMNVVLYRFDDSAYAKKGQVGFLAFSRAGGNLMDLNALKLYQHPAS